MRIYDIKVKKIPTGKITTEIETFISNQTVLGWKVTEVFTYESNTYILFQALVHTNTP